MEPPEPREGNKELFNGCRVPGLQDEKNSGDCFYNVSGEMLLNLWGVTCCESHDILKIQLVEMH